MKLDYNMITSEISRVKPKTVLFRCPDGYINLIQELAFKIEGEYDVQTIVSGDPCYGTCDIFESTNKLSVDLTFQIGHSSSNKNIGKKNVMINIHDYVDFKNVIELSLPVFKKYKKLGLSTISQYLHQLDLSRKMFEEKGFEIYVGKAHDHLLTGQIFGCRFHTAFSIRDKVEANVFLGQSRFHAIGLALATGLDTYMLDPYSLTVENIKTSADTWYKKAILRIYKALDAESFGIIIGLKEGQMMFNRALQIRNHLLSNKKKVQLISLREITEDRLALFRGVDAFIQTACPRISLDGESFSKPVLSLPQAQALFELMDGRELNEFLEKSCWL